jgi:Zn-dependent protease with chaperone function
MNAPIAVKTTLLLLGMAVGVVGGLCLSFAMGALFARKIMNAKPAPEGELRDALTQLFLKSKCDVPEFWVIDSQETHLGNVMMAGFPKGRGFFKPGFFVSSRIFGALTEGEFRSVVLHEISHWRLKHLKRRFIFSAGLILCASLITGLSVLSSRLAGVSEQGQTLVGFTSLLTSFLFAFRLLARLVKFQEIAADIHSIEKLGSALSDLSSALRKLDKAETGQSLRPDPSLLRPPRTLDPESMLVSLGHPGTEHRIRVLERYFERQAQLKKEAAKAEQSDSQAA